MDCAPQTRDAMLTELAGRALDLHRMANEARLRHIVRPSIPILYFGDSELYFHSPLRVVTVGLNPSREEFPPRAPFERFPGGDAVGPGSEQGYLGVLNNYFRTRPYTRWFNQSFEDILIGMGASYYDRGPSVALHTDLCSPLATDPTWSGLNTLEKATIAPEGRRLWHALIESLEPDVVLISVRRALLSTIDFPRTEGPTVLFSINGSRRKPYRVEVCRHRLSRGKTPLFVFGQAAQMPFGSISALDKRTIGVRIRSVLDA